ncbi:bifunctional aspartate kinase/homoserine dehydrogenase I [Blochmannia endosymbiont of Polyrhachis (Hedomyrma) turneri]|uniref:bifunctional aspartate kinase/homoserine dehydrogenase I n=1 Tax=Blochmannia endosymbiont of Polyrhachis (Hedomyrma) turneri TaxID=1505596 RepID=UPI00061A76DA|nr:bifunctional aspartate kinase/homoserine dehydrogenase I [Blochmannia endosymbiont of Polyrhachis (Hedomyrma) turneri]AKC59695.1 Bifunctional aspartokinase/homoserine dehydrogenase 1 [Blochmannia endosymbiont of Polyrhachis (Hedomyrma) turneri]
MRVLKFGGTSLADADCFIHVVNILESKISQDQVAVVLSAPAFVTNYLVAIVENTLNGIDHVLCFRKIESIFNQLLIDMVQLQPNFNHLNLRIILDKKFNKIKNLLHGVFLLRHCPDSINASIISLGETLSIVFMEALLVSRGFSVTIINPVKKLLAYGSYLASMVDIKESTRRIQDYIIHNNNSIILMPGFIAGNEHGELVVLGRNGSDYSATVLAACTGATCCEIWTDVDGVYTCDPHQVPDAQLLSSLSYQEAMELSYFGAKVLHPRTIMPIAQFQIPCFIKNIFNPQSSGTFIGPINSEKLDINSAKGITYLNDIVMINVSGPGMKGMIGIAARVFLAMSRASCSVILITQSSSEYSISFCLPNYELLVARKALEDEFFLELKDGLLEPLDIMDCLAIISVVGDGMRTQVGLSSKLFNALSHANINIIAIAQGSSERSISVVVNNSTINTGVRIAHQMLFNTNQIIEIFIVGVGGIGSALIEQIHRQYLWLMDKHIDLRICGIANSKSMLLDFHGIDLSCWKSSLLEFGESFHINNFINSSNQHHLFNPVIVDCTNSIDIANQYIFFLESGFHVVTPNKKANTGSMEYYRQIRTTALKTHRKFLYDTNVGAGLPVIENLQNLLHAGDELTYFSGILSGSLSFVFGKLDEGMPLSQSILTAHEKGYTEPDPREDLSGMDVARKLLILAREVGYSLELNDIYVCPVVSNVDIDEENLSDFLEKLSFFDHDFLVKVQEAHKLGRVLRYVGSINQGHCRVRIESIDDTNPLFKIKDGENALTFFTRYYQPIPLVLRGYGAGNNVTAAGVFADILRTLSWKVGYLK